ncbi:MAG: tetratricopeptide repeat protein [Bacteroidota bacterium]|nr:tetratricopeptide repeat protein [Bacteroidota bacterium]
MNSIAQNGEIRGRVLFQNSGKKPAVGVEIRAKGANLDYSSSDGSFRLQYAYKQPGDNAELILSTKVNYKVNIELVNSEAVRAARIPIDPEDSLYIIVCHAGQLAQSRQHYYKISENKLKSYYDQQLKKLTLLLSKSKGSDLEKLELHIKIDSLTAKYNSVIEKAAVLADYIASINKDFASEIVREAIEKIDSDNDIEGALLILDDNRLDQAYIQAKEKKELADQEIKKITEGYMLKSNILMANFRYKEAAACIQKVIDIWEENKFEKRYLAIKYGDLGVIYNESEDYTASIRYETRAIGILDSISSQKDPDYARNCNDIAVNYIALSNDSLALRYELMALALDRELGDSSKVAIAYGNLALIYLDMGKPELAFSYQKSDLGMILSSDSTSEHLITAYNNIGATFYKLKKFDEALKYEMLALETGKKLWNKDSPKLAPIYDNVSVVYQQIGKDSLASVYKSKGLSLYESIPDWKQHSKSYVNLSMEGLLEKTGDFNGALVYYEKVLNDIRNNIFSKHDQVTIYINLGDFYINKLKDTTRALDAYLNAVKYGEKFRPSTDTITAIAYRDIALIYQKQHNYIKEVAHWKGFLSLLDTSTHDLNNRLYGYDQYSLALSNTGDFQLAIYYSKLLVTVTKTKSPKKLKNAWDELSAIYYTVASAYYDKRQYRIAKTYADSACIEQVVRTEATNLKGLCYYALKDYPSAIKTYKNILYTDTPSVKSIIFNNIGLAYAKNRDFKQAEKYLTMYEQQKNDTARATRDWGLYYALKGEPEKALTYLERAVMQGYTDKYWFSNDDGLETLRSDKRFNIIIAKLNDTR